MLVFMMEDQAGQGQVAVISGVSACSVEARAAVPATWDLLVFN